MINKVARILLNCIQENKPKNLIIRIAKVLYKLAYNYKETIIKRFIEMLGQIPERTLITLITTEEQFDVGDAVEKPNLEKNERLERILKNYTTEEIEAIANKIIENSPYFKNTLAQRFKGKDEELFLKTPENEIFSFLYTPTKHFAHRKYLRDVTETELNSVIREYSIGLISNYRETTRNQRRTQINNHMELFIRLQI